MFDIKIVTRLRGFLVIFLYFFGFSVRSSSFWESRDNGVVKKFAMLTLKPRGHVRILHIEDGLFKSLKSVIDE